MNKSDTSWMADCVGIGSHWTSDTILRDCSVIPRIALFDGESCGGEALLAEERSPETACTWTPK